MKANDNYDPMRRWGCSALVALWLLAAALIVFVCLSLGGCSPRTVHVPVETVQTEYKDREVNHLITDTVYDTRFVWVKGDTVVDIREKEHLRRIEIHDTCYIERTDSVALPYPVVRELSRWEQAKMDFGGFALGGVAVALCIAVVWLIRKFRK